MYGVLKQGAVRPQLKQLKARVAQKPLKEVMALSARIGSSNLPGIGRSPSGFPLQAAAFSTITCSFSTMRGSLSKTDAFAHSIAESHRAFCPDVGPVMTLFKQAGEHHVVNDHVAFRTFSDEAVGLDAIAAYLKRFGYQLAGPQEGYQFPSLHLKAQHFESPGQQMKIFVSELLLDELPRQHQAIVRSALASVPEGVLQDENFLTSGRLWSPVTVEQYQMLRAESEYAAWTIAHGYKPNHVTISVHDLEHFEDISKVNAFLSNKGYELNTDGGEIKGKREEGLLQSSIVAPNVTVEFADAELSIPGGFIELAERPLREDGTRFEAFKAQNAQRIFTSTNVRH